MNRHTFTLLLVEDNEAHALLIEHALGDVGRTLDLELRTRTVADGLDAIAYLLGRPPHDDPQASPRPDLVLLDLNLPGADGFEVLRAMRSNRRSRYIPVVVLSSSESYEDVRRAHEAGTNAYLVKPIGFSEFRDLLTSALAFWSGCARLA